MQLLLENLITVVPPKIVALYSKTTNNPIDSFNRDLMIHVRLYVHVLSEPPYFWRVDANTFYVVNASPVILNGLK